MKDLIESLNEKGFTYRQSSFSNGTMLIFMVIFMIIIIKVIVDFIDEQVYISRRQKVLKAIEGKRLSLALLEASLEDLIHSGDFLKIDSYVSKRARRRKNETYKIRDFGVHDFYWKNNWNFVYRIKVGFFRNGRNHKDHIFFVDIKQLSDRFSVNGIYSDYQESRFIKKA